MDECDICNETCHNLDYCSNNCNTKICHNCSRFKVIDGDKMSFCNRCFVKIELSKVCHSCNEIFSTENIGSAKFRCGDCNQPICIDCQHKCGEVSEDLHQGIHRDIITCNSIFCKSCFNKENNKLEGYCDKCDIVSCKHSYVMPHRCHDCDDRICHKCTYFCSCKNILLCKDCYQVHQNTKRKVCDICKMVACEDFQGFKTFNKISFCISCYNYSIVDNYDLKTKCKHRHPDGSECQNNYHNSRLFKVNIPYIKINDNPKDKLNTRVIDYVTKIVCDEHSLDELEMNNSKKIKYCYLTKKRFQKCLVNKCQFCHRYVCMDYVKNLNNTYQCYKCYLIGVKIKKWFFEIKFNPEYKYCQIRLSKTWETI